MASHKPIVIGLGLGALGGAIFYLLRMPLPWMLGAMLATTIAAMSRVQLAVPRVMRNPMLAVLGVLLGSGFSLQLLENAWRWLPTLAVLPIYVLIVGGVSYIYLRRVTGFEPRTAYFAAAPGGFGEMVLLGEQAGGDMRRIALVHSVRVLLIVLIVPFGVRHMGLMLPAGATGAASAFSAPIGVLMLEWGVLIACAFLGAWTGLKLKLPAAALLGPMVLSAAAHIVGLAHSAPPLVIVAVAQVVIGSQIGARFTAFTLAEVMRTILAGIGLVIVMFTATLAIGLTVHWLTGSPPMAVLLALTPGGVAEMSLIALAMGIEPAFVATHHIVRIALVVALAPFFFRRIKT